MSARASTVAAGIAAMLVAACASGPPTPEWQMNARAALERSTAAYLVGDSRIEALEFDRARDQIARTGRADLLARAELLRCATRVASLVLDPCTGFDPLRADAPAAERAYADYLDARVAAQDVALLPVPHRAAAAALLAVPAGAEPATLLPGLLPDSTEPLSRLVAAGVLVRSGRVSPALLQAAVDTASAQGWRRPLLAWLGLQARRADQAGNTDEAARVRRRIALVEGEGRS